MEPSRKRLVAEVALASLLGLFPLAMYSISNRASLHGHDPLFGFVTRATFVLATVMNPGQLFGVLGGGIMDIAGSTTNLQRMEELLSVVANVVLFCSVWIALRTLPKTSRLRRLTILAVTVWFVFAIPMAIFGSMWMVL